MDLIISFITGVISLIVGLITLIGFGILKAITSIPRKRSWCFNRLNVKFSLEPLKEILDFFYTRKK
ncbi:hypothetical protein ACQ9ZF_10950 (plasmid) [Cetobacterium somerae]|uniref:hypothetical protein n=1 Tax=Cetobacterium somerae TaxID=188913 RepID=UPI003D769CF1